MPRPSVIISDSRGEEMGEQILKLNNLGVPIITYVYKGRTLRALASEALIYASHHRNEVIYIYRENCSWNNVKHY